LPVLGPPGEASRRDVAAASVISPVSRGPAGPSCRGENGGMRGNALARTSAAVAVTAALGGVAVDPRSRWYRRLTKPRWQPPSWVVGIVWTALYADLAATSAAALSEASTPRERPDYRRGVVVNPALSAGWNWLFWRVRKPWPSTVEAAAFTI